MQQSLFNADFPELPGYSIRVSSRARHVNLRVTPEEGLTIVVPRRFSMDELPAILDEKKAWIDNALSWAADQRRQQPEPLALPVNIDLAAVGENWKLERNPSASTRTMVRQSGFRRLKLCGNVYDTDASTRALGRWLSRRSRATLVPWCAELGKRYGLPMAGATVRNQRSCWASCSPSRTINVNRKLLFLPRHLARYVLLHELCHTVELNHSQRFWRHVGKVEPDFRLHEKELRSAWELVPGWAGN
jgi:predicted metal-dependent hydrolase